MSDEKCVSAINYPVVVVLVDVEVVVELEVEVVVVEVLVEVLVDVEVDVLVDVNWAPSQLFPLHRSHLLVDVL